MPVTGEALGHVQTKKGATVKWTILISNWDKPKTVILPSPERFFFSTPYMCNFVFKSLVLPVLSYSNISRYTITGIFKEKDWSKIHCSSGGVQHGVIQMRNDNNFFQLANTTTPSLLALSDWYFGICAPFTPHSSWRWWVPKWWNNSGVESVYVYVWERVGGKEGWMLHLCKLHTRFTSVCFGIHKTRNAKHDIR